MKIKQHHLRISEKFCGPPDSVNGGYLGGMLARQLIERGVPANSEMTLSLLAPTPIQADLVIENDSDGALGLFFDDAPVARMKFVKKEGDSLSCPFTIPEHNILITQAEKVRSQCAGFQNHPFQHCFVCGPKRKEGDGLCIYPGPFLCESVNLVIAKWIPTQALQRETSLVAHEFVWAAMDCPGAFAILEQPESSALVPMVLASMTARVNRCPGVGETLSVVAWMEKRDGRKAYAGSALIDSNNEQVAVSHQLWISLNKPT